MWRHDGSRHLIAAAQDAAKGLCLYIDTYRWIEPVDDTRRSALAGVQVEWGGLLASGDSCQTSLGNDFKDGKRIVAQFIEYHAWT